MNFDHLRLFVRIASAGSISRAGHDLGLSPAVASTHLGKLEAALGVRLVHRTTRKVALTEDGQAFLPHAEELLSSVEAARAAVGAGSVRPTGTLRVTAPASFGRMHLLPVLEGFMKAHPDLAMDLRLSDTMMDLVEGGFDVAIRNAALKDSGLTARRLAPDRRVLCASPGYLARHGEPGSPKDLHGHRCITLVGMEQWTFRTPDGSYNFRASGVVRTDSGEVVREACTAGLGITINSTWSAHEELRRGALVPILVDYPLVPETAIWAVYPSARLLAPKVRAFVDHVLGRFGDTPYWDRGLA